jgi:3D (Asp-Asp-Asp) domain-containing protein
MYVPGYGFGIAADTGGGIKGNMIDLGYADGVSPDWHTGWVDVYLLSP